MTSIPETFRAYVYESFSDDALKVIKLRSGVTHETLAPDQVRIKVHSAALNPIDYGIVELGLKLSFITSSPSGDAPFRMGYDAAGTLVEAGADVKNLSVGDEVYATGAFGIQIAKAFGVYVVAITSARNIELVKSFGADQVIDYTAEKWSNVLEHHSIDVIYDCGIEPQAFVTIGIIEDPTKSPIEAELFQVRAQPTSDFAELTKLIEADKLRAPIDSVYKFEDLRETMKKQKTGRARGKLILEVIPEPQT